MRSLQLASLELLAGNFNNGDRIKVTANDSGRLNFAKAVEIVGA